MDHHSCDLCHHPAVIHDTLAQGGVVRVRHLCRAHGMKLWQDALPPTGIAPEALSKDPVFQSFVAESEKPLHRRGRDYPTA